jgi:hypothetical protein
LGGFEVDWQIYRSVMDPGIIRCHSGGRKEQDDNMDNIIPFPIKRTDQLNSVLQTFRGCYLEAGLSEQDCDSALREVRPILEEHLNDKFESVMDIPACGLTNEQVEIIKSAHNKCVREILSQYEQKVGLALCQIRGLVGSKYTT